MTLLTLIRRQFRDIRWSLACSLLAFFGLAILWNWGVSRSQFPPPEEPGASARADEGVPDEGGEDAPVEPDGVEDGTPPGDPEQVADGEAGLPDDPEADPDSGPRGRRRGLGIYIGMGVPAEALFDPDNPPTLLMQVCMANHPLILLTLMGWAIARASMAVAGEIERGTLDLTLTRPVRRSTYLASHVVVALLVFALLGAALILGHLVSPMFYRLADPPGPGRYLPATLMLVGLGLAIFGYALALSARDLSRARAGILALGVTLAGVAGMITSQQLEGYEWLSKLSVFEYYAPVGISADWGELMSGNLGVLAGVFAAGLLLSFVVFLRRDLPTNG